MAAPAFAQNRQQIIQLHTGWNAVFLEVEPLDTNPQAVFTNTPVDIVARYFPRTSSVQYISNPADAPWNEPGWGVWYAPSRPESVVSSLHAIHGHKPYLVHTPSAYAWHVTGSVAFERLSWQADSFNLKGFGVDEQSPPTFERFFAGAGGRIGQRIYRLDAGGKWQPVTLPATTAIRSGEAYWVHCRGKTDYQGPLDVRVPGLGGLDFGSVGSRLDTEFFNSSAESVGVTVEVVPGSGDLPLAQVIRDLSLLQTSYPDLQSFTQLTVAAGQVETLRLEVRREAMTAAAQSRLLKLTTSQGLRYWIPVRAQRSGLAGQP
jgi:hypothetical protein